MTEPHKNEHDMISLSQGHCCSTTLCNKILKGKVVWIFWKYHMGVPRVGSDSKQMWNLTQSVEGWWRTRVQENSKLLLDIWLQMLCGIVLKEEGLTLVTHYFNPFSWVSLVPLFFSFYLMYSIVSILSSEFVLHKWRTVSC